MPNLLLLIILSGLLHITGLYVKSPSLKYIFKPLTTLLIIFLAIHQGGNSCSQYKILILGGLVFSLAGDIFLMLRRERFVAGLVSFLLAHILFISAFVSYSGVFLSVYYLIPVLIYFAVFLVVLLPHTGKMSLPVIIYAVVLLLFLWQASGQYAQHPAIETTFAFGGAVLFVLSDSLLAFNKFVKTLKWAPALLMVLYWAALYFLALSI